MLYRFISFKRVAQIIHEGRDCLVHPRRWPDPFESRFLYGRVLTPRYIYDGKSTGKPPPPGTPYKKSNGMLGNPNHIRAHFLYSQCWSRRDESDALWRTTDTSYVRISIADATLQARIASAAGANRLTFGDVTYEEEAVVLARRTEYVSEFRPRLGSNRPSVDSWFAATVALLREKRSAFDFEREHRVVLFDESGQATWEQQLKTMGGPPKPPDEYEEDVPALYPYDLNFNSDIDGVLIHPKLKGQDLRNQYLKLKEVGVSVPIRQSALYRNRNFDIWTGKHQE